MDQLIQTGTSAIIYGKFRGNENEELFRCPRSTEETDLPHYINEHRALVCPMGTKIPFENDYAEDLRNIEGKTMIGYFRMYYRYGWSGRWLFEGNEKPDIRDASGVQKIIDWLCDRFPKGCDWEFKEFFKENFKTWGGEKRYLIKPFKSEYYKVMIDTTYGNGDYPVRIYCYKDNERR